MVCSVPWLIPELERPRELFGDDRWPYGVEVNRKKLETKIDYSFERGLAFRKPIVEDLFSKSTLKESEALRYL